MYSIQLLINMIITSVFQFIHCFLSSISFNLWQVGEKTGCRHQYEEWQLNDKTIHPEHAKKESEFIK